VSAAAPSQSVDLSVNFEFNSAELTPQGRELLSRLSQALASKELSGISSVTLEGHTDGLGSSSYNQVLSLRRAQSVHAFLQSVPELRGKMFRVVGKGASELSNKDDPADASNRRVRVSVFYDSNAAKQ
jgi:outer membrane protein OmpA-like peptidoglycan-associated protein